MIPTIEADATARANAIKLQAAFERWMKDTREDHLAIHPWNDEQEYALRLNRITAKEWNAFIESLVRMLLEGA